MSGSQSGRLLRSPVAPNARMERSHIRRAAAQLATLAVCLVVVAGCRQLTYRLKTEVPPAFVPNPLELPPAQDVFVWSQVVDALDDYFRVSREQPVVNSSGIILDGRLETAYRVGGSIFEPWRKDSTAGFERLQSTLQSIRRRAVVTVRPRGAGYMLEVIVHKDLEDTDRSQYSTESVVSTRHDGTVVRREDAYDDSPITLGWIPLGRDTSLEQVILQDIFGRITQADSSGLGHH